MKLLQIRHISTYKQILLLAFFLQANTIIAQYQIQKVHGSYCAGSEAGFILTASSCNYINWSITGGQILEQSDVYVRVQWTSSSAQLNASYSCGMSGNASTGWLTISNSATPSVSITANNNNVCVGTSVTFTASPTNGGSFPYYSWKVNGSTASGSTNSSTYTTTGLSDNDVVTCVMNTSLACYTQYSGTSNAITMNLTAKQVMTVTISGPSSVCSGTTGDFYAHVSNGAGTLTYKWFKNGSQQGSTSNPLIGLSVSNNDIITCEVRSSDPCVQSPATSNNFTITVTGIQSFIAGTSPSDINICSGDNVIFTATSSHTATSYQWKMNGSNQEGETNNTFSATASSTSQLQSVQVIVTTNASCVNQTTTTGSAQGIPFVVKALPNATITGPATGCGSALLQSSTGTGYSYVWKNSSNATVGTSSTYSATASGSYRVITTQNGCSKESSPKSVTINSIPLSPASVISGSRCGTGVVNLSGTAGTNGNSLRWYSASSGGSVLSTGTSYSTQSISTTTPYYVSSYNTSTTCESTTPRVSVNATINQLPTVYSVTGGGSYCEAGAGVQIGLNDTQTGVNYQLKRGTSNVGSLIGGTNSAINFGNQTTVGTYTVVASNSSTSCLSNMSSSATVALHPILSAPSATNNDRCGSGTVILTGSPGTNGNNLKWYSASSGGTALTTNASFTTPSLNNTTTYYISNYNTSTLCESITTRVAVSAIINSNPIANAGSDLSYFVTNSSATLSGASPVGGSWSGTGVSGSTFTPNTAGTGTHTITYHFTDGNSCSDTDTRSIGVYAKPIAATSNSFLERGGSTLLTLGSTYDSYQWYHDDDILSGATGSTYSASKIGDYKAAVNLGGSSEYTDPITISSAIEQANNMNYVISHTIQKEGVLTEADINNLGVHELVEQIQFFDGLGRPIQAVTTQGSHDGFDIVQPIVYDEFGREAIQYLPYVSGDQSGLYKTDAIDINDYENNSQQYFFYDGRTEKVASDNAPYAVKLFEASPLNRVLEQGAPGEDWQPIALGDPANKTVKMSYETNAVKEVRLFDIETSNMQPTSNALEFDGTNDYVALDMFYNQQGRFTQLTFEAWVNTTFSGGGWTDNWSIIDFDRSEFFNVFIRGDNGKVEFSTYATSGSVNDFAGNTSINDGEWHHLAVVYDGTDKIIYVDGVEDARVTNPHNGVGIGKNITRYGFIGDGSEATSFNGNRNSKYYDGKIGEIKFWDVARTETEIQNDAYSSSSSSEAGLLAWWSMKDGKGSNTLTDLTLNGNDGTLVNMDLNNCWVIGKYEYYNQNMLSVVKTTDEHNNVVKTYTDKLGNTVLKRVYLSASEILDTYYIYDDFNNLRVVLPPEAVNNFDALYNSNPAQFLDNWAFLYKYDGRNRMTHKKVPGADTVFMVYDQRDRLILTQDGNQRNGTYQGSGTDWMFTKYDTLNRPILSGIYSHSFEIGQETMQAHVNNTFDGSSVFYTEQRGDEVHGYTSHAFPSVLNKCEYLTVTYYDDYDFITDQSSVWGMDYNFIDNYGIYDVDILNRVRGQVTGAKTKILGEDEWIKSVLYYNRKYRVVQSATSNLLEGVDQSFIKYDFTGKVMQSRTIHEAEYKKNKLLGDSFTYDHTGRQIDQYSTIGEAVTWTDKVGITESNNDIIKTVADAWGNAGASTVDKIPAGKNGWIEVRAIKDNARTMLGLSTSNANAHYNTINFAIYYHYGGSVQIYESGSLKGTVSSFKTGDIFRVERIGSSIIYKQNGETIYTSTKTDNGDLIGDISIYYADAGMHEVFMSTTGTTLLARNDYNKLGELIDKKLHSSNSGADFMQSVDYAYNIRGWLTNINESDLSQQGDDPIDFFGMELGYNLDIGTGADFMHNGNISAIKWSNFGGVDGIGERAYNYGYDNINRLLSASHKVKTGVWASAADAVKVDNIDYDYNGNIKSLNRKDLLGSGMDQLTYDYGTGINQSNKLISVSDAGNLEKGFKDGHTGGDDYFYDANGNMNEDKNKGILFISYNHLNLPDSLNMGDGKAIKYTYDAAGLKQRQTVFEGVLAIKQTDYIGGFIYEDTVLQLIQHAEGRIVPQYTSDGTGKLKHFVYEYHLKDHLGNVRLTFTSEPGEDTYTATFENDTQQQEQADFYPSYDDITRVNASIYDHTDNGSSSYSLMLDGQPNRIIGLAKSMQVLPGDTITMEVFGKYLAANTTDNNLAAAMAPAITGAFGLTASATGELLKAYNSLNGLFGAGPLIGSGEWENEDAPKTYLNYILFDRNFVSYDMGIDQIDIDAFEDGTDIPHDQMYLEAYVTKPGYVYIYLSNENPKQLEVYYDDMKVTHNHTPVIQTDDYYPFGLTFNEYQNSGEQGNNFLFQGQELQTDLDLGWYSFKWRNHDPAIGRFFNVDPLAEAFYYNSPYAFSENKVTSHIELEGLEAIRYDYTLKPDEMAVINGEPGARKQFRENANARTAGALIGLAINYIIWGSALGPVELVPTLLPDSNLPDVPDPTPEEPKPDELKPEGSRTEPIDLQEKLTLEEAQGGEGEEIMKDRLKDPKYDKETGTKDKIGHNHDHGDGSSTEVHYDRDRETGKGSDYKIKDDTNKNSRGNQTN